MSPGASSRAAGFSCLLGIDGETLTLEGSATKIQALVNRTIKNNDIQRFEGSGAVDFTANGLSMIEFLQSAFTPVAGSSFLDDQGVRHRVRRFMRTEFSWQCLCLQSDVIP